MAEKLSLPLILPNPPPHKPFFQDSHHHHHHSSALPPPPPSLNPLFHHLQTPQNSIPLPTIRRRIGKHGDPNKGKPWSHHNRLSPQGELTLRALIHPEFDNQRLDQILLSLVNSYYEDNTQLSLETLRYDVSSIIKALGHHKKCDVALSVFQWFRKHSVWDSLLKGSVAAVVITMLGKEGRVSAAASLLHNLHIDGFGVDVYTYTSMITAYANNRRYREAVMIFKKMEEEGCKPTLITYNVILNVYGKMGMPWNTILGVLDAMRDYGVEPDAYTYNTLISCCRRGSLYEEAKRLFEEMKLAGFAPDKVTYNALLDVYGKSRRSKEAMEVLQEMEANGSSPSIVTL